MESILTAPERSDLRRLEKVVETGLAMFHPIGEALKQIRDQKLYREKWKTFEAYCEERFGIKRSYAHRLIEAVEIKMLPMGNKIKNERQAREVAKAPRRQRNKVVKLADKIATERDQDLTAKVIEEAREIVVEGEVVKPKKPKAGAEKVSPAKIIDEFYKAHYSKLPKALDRAAEAIGSKGPNYRAADKALNDFSAAVKNMREGKP